MTELKFNDLFVKKFVLFIFVFLVLEGAIRKWLFPSYQLYVYFIKDFLLLFIYYLGFRNKYFFSSKLNIIILIFILFLSLISLFKIDFTYNEIVSYFLGIRSYFLYLPLFLIIIYLFKPSDLKKFYNINIFIYLAYFILTIIQYKLPSEYIINSGFNSLVQNPERPSGTFMYVTQNSIFVSFLITGFATTFLEDLKYSKKYLAVLFLKFFILASLVILLKSRMTYLFFLLLMFLTFITCFFIKINPILKIKKIIILLAVFPLIFFVSSKIFEETYKFSTKRFNTDTYEEMYIVKKYKKSEVFGTNLENFCKNNSSICRVINDLYFFREFSDNEFLGKGIGSGTSAVAKFSNREVFSLGESENSRVFLELGPIFGFFINILKYLIIIYFFIALIKKSKYYLIPSFSFMSSMLLLSPITYSVSFINFIFWFIFASFILSVVKD